MVLIVVPLAGCVPGYNSVLFTTQANAGLDLDTEPPTTKLDISRDEGVITPVFEGGQTIPVIASFSTSGGAVGDFFFGADSVFATGDSAYLMARLYDSTDGCSNQGYDTLKKEGAPLLSVLPEGLPLRQSFVTQGQVKPVTFGTDTMLGVRIGWSAQTSALPNSMKVGFNRKEVAWAPITMETHGSGVRANTPSLLATVSSDVRAGGISNQKMRYIQYFATGGAADRLACQPGVRAAMRARLDPEAERFDQAAARIGRIRSDAALVEQAGDGLIAAADQTTLDRYATLMLGFQFIGAAPTGSLAAQRSALQSAFVIQDETDAALAEFQSLLTQMQKPAS